MAGKARRAAARQSELSRRRKKGQRGPSGIPATSQPPDQPGPGGGAPALAMQGAGVVSGASAVGPLDDMPEPVVEPTTQAVPQATTRPRASGRLRGDRPTAYNYVGSEMRRIAALTTVVLAAVVALSFVL